MYTKEINVRSPLRVFEKSIHGGLGKGNLGTVLSRAGVGKTAFLIGVALDDLMRGRPVLHVSAGDSVLHVREFYDELFDDLKTSMHMEDARETHLRIERSRIIHTCRGVELTPEKLIEYTEFYSRHLHFDPDVVVVDGFDFAGAGETDLVALKEYAVANNVEVWLSALTHREDPSPPAGALPHPVARFEAWISVVVCLEPHPGSVNLRLLKDHENEDLESLKVKLDPKTLLLLEER